MALALALELLAEELMTLRGRSGMRFILGDDFRKEVICKLKHEEWTLTAEEIRNWVYRKMILLESEGVKVS